MARLKLLQVTLFLGILSSFVRAENQMMNSRKLDETTPPDLDNKCGNCPCDKPCLSPPPPSPPPPPQNPPPSNNCPPPPLPPLLPSPPSSQKPPSSPYIYINGPPGSVYPVYPYYSGEGQLFPVGIIPFLIGNILWVLAF